MKDTLLTCEQVCKEYREGSNAVPVLFDVNFSLKKGEQVAILGSSGSGKSTLLHILGALDNPTSGKVCFSGQDVFAYSEKQQAQFRNQNLGFVYQFHHLLGEFTALENVAMPLLIGKVAPAKAKQQAAEMLEKVGLGQRLKHRPGALSGGERQRVAIARALVTKPQLVLADEPTGNLDHKTGEGIYQLLRQLKNELETSFVVVTHDIELACRLDRVCQLTDGRLSEANITQLRAAL